jgi:hypothetical protein
MVEAQFPDPADSEQVSAPDWLPKGPSQSRCGALCEQHGAQAMPPRSPLEISLNTEGSKGSWTQLSVRLKYILV